MLESITYSYCATAGGEVVDPRCNFSLEVILHRVKIVFFTLLGLGAAALVAEQSSVSAPAQEPGANQHATSSGSGPTAGLPACSRSPSFGLSGEAACRPRGGCARPPDF